MSDDLVETGINWEHDTGNICISTRKASLTNKLKRMGLVPDNDEGPNGYATFKSNDKSLSISIRHKQKRKLTPEHVAAMQAGRRAKKR